MAPDWRTERTSAVGGEESVSRESFDRVDVGYGLGCPKVKAPTAEDRGGDRMWASSWITDLTSDLSGITKENWIF